MPRNAANSNSIQYITPHHLSRHFSQCKMTIVQPTVHVRVHVALTRQSPPAADVLFKMGQKRTPKTAAGEREQWTKEWAGEGTATVPDTSEGMERQQPMTAVCSCSTKTPQRPPSNHPCLLDCFPYSLCSSRCRSNLRDLCMPYLSALLLCQPTLSACSSPATAASLAVLLWTHAACARHDKVVVHKVHVVAASTPTCSDVGPHLLQLVLVVLLLGSN